MSIALSSASGSSMTNSTPSMIPVLNVMSMWSLIFLPFLKRKGRRAAIIDTTKIVTAKTMSIALSSMGPSCRSDY